MSSQLAQVLQDAVEVARRNTHGRSAHYIPELANVDPELTSIVVQDRSGVITMAGNAEHHRLTLQSTGKLVVLIGLLEEFGLSEIMAWVRLEPSGDDFSSIARLDQFGPVPSNPMLNAGAISLCSRIPGNFEQQQAWLQGWAERLFGAPVSVDPKVMASECSTGDRNRSLAYLLQSNQILGSSVEDTLKLYFGLCSYEVAMTRAVYLPYLLLRKGVNEKNEVIFSEKTAQYVLALMATCGLYNESGGHFVKTGMPAKSGVSGLILATAMGQAGIAVASPRVNRKGTSIRGAMMLEYLSREMGWHFV